MNNNRTKDANNMNNFIKLASAFVFAVILNTGNAYSATIGVLNGSDSALGQNNTPTLTSNGNDGVLVLNNALTLSASNNQVFNYTVVNLQAGSTLDFSGLISGDSVFILGTGDLTLDGIINLPSYTNFTFQTSGNILFGGSVLTSNSNVSFISNVFQSSANSLISNISGSISITTETNIVINGGKFDVGGTITPHDPSKPVIVGLPVDLIKVPIIMIPEPSSYVLLTIGLLTVTYRFRKFNS